MSFGEVRIRFHFDDVSKIVNVHAVVQMSEYLAIDSGGNIPVNSLYAVTSVGLNVFPRSRVGSGPNRSIGR